MRLPPTRRTFVSDPDSQALSTPVDKAPSVLNETTGFEPAFGTRPARARPATTGRADCVGFPFGFPDPPG